ncbi:MAG: 16S rRNA (cytosine(967)-C(5))-methyltransferase RsmB [Burkholderiales bacterium]|nr:16S rRNA (cytosine(967)-C(5))-methyltransferase RsmB [Burkholderiales bacterium]
MTETQRLASRVVGSVLAGRSLDVALAALWRRQPGLEIQQRAAIQDICFGTLRFLGRIDAMLDALLDRPLRDDALRVLLRVSVYQLEYTRAPPYAIIDHAVRACEALRLASAKGLVNAVLRNFLRRRAALAAQAQRTDPGRFSYPQWWIDRLRIQYPDHYAGILDAGNLHPPFTLRVNRRRAAMDKYLAWLERETVTAQRIGDSAIQLATPLAVECIPGFTEGMVSVQDAAAQHAAPLLQVENGMRVLDACAAPGGKTAHLLELADIDLTALDSSAARLERVRANLSRLGFAARVICGDAAAPDGWWDGQPYDRILADVPCSASGVVRRHPDIKWLRRESDIGQFAAQQQRILDALWRTLASGGKLLYATCSVFQEENQRQVADFLDRHRDARRLTFPGAETHLQQAAGQLLPDERHDGFFYALLAKA